jgi:hypothetical protein
MGDQWGSVRTTEGELVVDDDALRIRRTPRGFLRGQRARWRNRGGWARISAAGRVSAFLTLPVFAAWRFAGLAGTTAGSVAFALFMLALSGAVPLWLHYSRETAVPLSAVEAVAIDPEDRELTVTHDPMAADPSEGRLYYVGDDLGWSLLTTESVETDLSLRSDDDVRAARTLFRTADVVETVETADSASDTDTEYRYETVGGVVCCPDCGRQVSPADRACSVCGAALRVEQPVDPNPRERAPEGRDTREPAVEF